ncbi:hypothetical protein PAPYR_7024 [Paratrimastix pyriformis]|uniref:Plectin n=1 Tax=Paratrimastix pyriformis TaxID=342808 RepID=A0ABQ8UL92_9EUKA|nr:hypothetical protein PAPYR_7024 [Paratrimastix pyriformis]
MLSMASRKISRVSLLFFNVCSIKNLGGTLCAFTTAAREQQFRDAKAAVEQLTARVQAQEQELAEYGQLKDEHSTLVKSHEALRASYQALEEECAHLRGQLDQQGVARTQAEARIAELTQARQADAQQLEALVREKADLTGQVGRLTDELAHLRAELGQAQARNSEAFADLGALREASQQSSDALAAIQSAHRLLQDQLRAREAEIRQLTEERARSSAEARSMVSKLDAAQTRREADLRRQLEVERDASHAEAKATEEEHQRVVDGLHRQILELRGQAAMLGRQGDEARQGQEALRRELAEVRAQMEEARRAGKELEERLSASGETLQSREALVRQLQADLQAAQAELADAPGALRAAVEAERTRWAAQLAGQEQRAQVEAASQAAERARLEGPLLAPSPAPPISFHGPCVRGDRTMCYAPGGE